METSEYPKAGLRQTKKRRTEADILANAIRRFQEQGVRDARLAEVASDSGVSPATLFNYFPNKGALADAWMRSEIRDLLEVSLAAAGQHGLRPTLRRVCVELARLADTQAERVVRLEAWREAGRAPWTALAADHALVAAVTAEQEYERVRKDISSQALAEMLVEALEGGVVAGLSAGNDEGQRVKMLRERVDLILDGARKKNERVEAPVSRSIA